VATQQVESEVQRVAEQRHLIARSSGESFWNIFHPAVEEPLGYTEYRVTENLSKWESVIYLDDNPEFTVREYGSAEEAISRFA
jgi:hypothetical protein